MNWDRVEGNWKEFKGKVQQKWGKLTDDDLEVIEGSLRYPLPIVLGHEAAGVVEQVGSAARGVEVGDHVVLSWNPHCGHCFYCDRDAPILCEQYLGEGPKGVAFDGGTRTTLADGRSLQQLMFLGSFGEYCILADQQAIAVPREIPFDRACLIGCGVMTGVGALPLGVVVALDSRDEASGQDAAAPFHARVKIPLDGKGRLALFDKPIDQPLCLAVKGLSQDPDGSGRQDAREHGAGAGVERRIGLQDDAGRTPRRFFSKIAQADACGRAIGLPIGQGVADLLVPGHCPDAILLEPNHRTGLAQRLMMRIGVLQECVGKRIERRNRPAQNCLIAHDSAPDPVFAMRLSKTGHLAGFAGDCHLSTGAI